MSGLRYGVALACAAAQVAAAAGFHPVEERPYRVDVTQTRIADGVTRRFHVRRSVVFHRVDGGFDATVALGAVDRPAGDAGKMFAAATGALLDA